MRIYPVGLLRSVLLAAAFGLAVLGGVLSMPIPTPAQNVQIDMDAVFRCTAADAEGRTVCDQGRELILNNCTTCHSFAPIVMQQFDEDSWRGLLERHRPRVPDMPDAQIDTMRTYLAANFNGELEPPELPPALLRAWAAYAR